MSQLYFLSKLALVGVVTLSAISAVGFTSTTAQAANLSFTPPGYQLDEDAILDIKIGSNQQLDFTISLNTTGLADVVDTFRYVVNFDPSELRFEGMVGLVSQGLASNNQIRPLGNNLNIPVGATQPITTMRFRTVNPGIEPHDGIFDFRISEAAGRFNNKNLIPKVITYGPSNDHLWQEVEVQQPIPEPTSTLSLFSLGILGAVATLKRKLKSKSPETQTV